jgi:hypothetical protein
VDQELVRRDLQCRSLFLHFSGGIVRDTICNKILCRCGPCSKASPKSLVNDDFNAYEGNVPATLFLDLAVATSVYFALFPRRVVGDNTAGSHGVPIRARQALFLLSH